MTKSVAATDVKKMVVACEAGMGSSLMVTNQLKKKVKQAKLDIQVAHTPARSIPQDAQVVFVHKGLAKLALEKAPWAVVIPFDNFMNIPAFDKVIDAIQNNGEIRGIG
ncbi:MAG: PTS system mannitol-specific EIICB component [Anaerolineae bacterium]|nr:PTS system mannitol-specific EIICB component [Anaerolineae bacterium]